MPLKVRTWIIGSIGKARRDSRGRIDYTPLVKVTADLQPAAVALIEAKAEHLLREAFAGQL